MGQGIRPQKTQTAQQIDRSDGRRTRKHDARSIGALDVPEGRQEKLEVASDLSFKKSGRRIHREAIQEVNTFVHINNTFRKSHTNPSMALSFNKKALLSEDFFNYLSY